MTHTNPSEWAIKVKFTRGQDWAYYAAYARAREFTSARGSSMRYDDPLTADLAARELVRSRRILDDYEIVEIANPRRAVSLRRVPLQRDNPFALLDEITDFLLAREDAIELAAAKHDTETRRKVRETKYWILAERRTAKATPEVLPYVVEQFRRRAMEHRDRPDFDPLWEIGDAAAG